MGLESKCANSGLYRTIHSGFDLNYHLGYWFSWMAVFLPKWIVMFFSDLAHLLPDPTTSERQYLSSETGHGCKWGSIVKQKQPAFQWNIMQYTSYPNNSRNNGFQNNFFVLILFLLSNHLLSGTSNFQEVHLASSLPASSWLWAQQPVSFCIDPFIYTSFSCYQQTTNPCL